MLLDLGLEAALAGGDLLLGLLADPGNLGLRPFANRGDVVVGRASEVGGLGRGPAMDGLDMRLGVGLELAQRPAAGLFGGGLHRLRQVGEELVRLLAGDRGWRRGDRLHLDVGVGRSVRGRVRLRPGIGDGVAADAGVGRPGRVTGVGRGVLDRGVVGLGRTVRAPRKPESASCVGRGHASCASPGGGYRGLQGLAAFWSRVVGVMESARGTSGAGRWYRRPG